MQEKNLNICQVSLIGNIEIVKENLLNFNKFYQNNYHYIICPKNEKFIFKKKISNINCEIVDEDTIITFKRFKKIANKYLKKKNYFKEIQSRLSWYYQQVLKLSFVLNFINKKKKPIIIWDADTIILKKILFFEKNNSINYGTTSEFHKAYYKTNEVILKNLPKYFLSSLAQFISITPSVFFKETKRSMLTSNLLLLFILIVWSECAILKNNSQLPLLFSSNNNFNFL